MLIDTLSRDADDVMLRTVWLACWSRALAIHQMEAIVCAVHCMADVYMERAVKSACRRKILRRRKGAGGIHQLYELNL